MEAGAITEPDSDGWEPGAEDGVEVEEQPSADPGAGPAALLAAAAASDAHPAAPAGSGAGASGGSSGGSSGCASEADAASSVRLAIASSLSVAQGMATFAQIKALHARVPEASMHACKEALNRHGGVSCPLETAAAELEAALAAERGSDAVDI